MTTPDTKSDTSSWMGERGRFVISGGKASLSLFWSVAWKTMAILTLILGGFFLWFVYQVAMEPNVEPNERFNMLIGGILFFGQCLFYGAGLSVGVGAFAVALRWLRAWILVPIVGTIIGSTVSIFLAFEIIEGWELRGGGLHGGGQIAAYLVIGFFALAAILGAVVGAMVSIASALMLRLLWRRKDKLSQCDQPTMAVEESTGSSR